VVGGSLYHLPMPLVIGATVAGFNVVRQLGYEEFGELYVAEHPTLPRQQVLHLIPAEISVDLDYRERFNQESDQAARLWHPSIAGLTDRGEFEGQLWISTEYIDGSDAAELLGENHPDGMPPRLVIEIVSEIADALDYVHDRGVLHRYVNPGNILVSKSPTDRRRIALTGFGVARPEGAHNTLTRAGMFIGSAGYTAPEQLMGEEIDGRVDQYALAASAFHLLTGSPPFAHFNPSVVVGKHLNEAPPRPSDVRPDLTEFDAIFARALSQDPVDRFRRCRDFAKALESTSGKRSHIYASSEVRAASIFREATQNGDSAATAFVATPKTDDPTPAEAAPETTAYAPVVRSNGQRNNHIDDAATTVAPAAPEEFDDEAFDDEDDEAAEARRRRLKHAAAIAGVIAVVLLAWFMGVKALRSASQRDDPPANVETTSAEPTTPAPAVIAPTPLVVAPPPPPPVAPPPPIATTAAPTTTVPKTTTHPTTTAPAQSTVPQTTVSKPAKPATTTPSGPNVLDTRPAVGMPCGAEGSAAVSNSGGPLTCVGTPGGFAWEPPGVQPVG
jgi:serine/threonine protein kinase, bacterial